MQSRSNSAFEHVTRMAIEQLIKENSHKGKFGYVVSEEALEELTDKLHELFLTSRNLRTAGQKFLSNPNQSRNR